jgi:TrmH family RNA methyltransferase
MKIIPLASAQNSLLKRIRSLHERSARQSAGLFLIEGEKVLAEALRHNISIEAIVISEEHVESLKNKFGPLNIDVHSVPQQLFKSLVTTTSPCAVVAIGRMQTASLDEFAGLSPLTLVVLENLQDPGNLGTIMRSALAFGADGLILIQSVDPFNPKVVRSAMGALFALPLVIASNIEEVMSFLRQENIESVALNPEASQTLTGMNFSKKTALLIGNEGSGLSKRADQLADKHASIAVSDKVESLNAAVAAAVVLFHLSQAERG